MVKPLRKSLSYYSPVSRAELNFARVLKKKTHLTPTRTLLEAIPDLLWSFTNSQVFLHISAVPLLLLEHHPQHVILCQSVLWGPAGLLEGIRSDQKVGTCNSHCSQLKGISSNDRVGSCNSQCRQSALQSVAADDLLEGADSDEQVVNLTQPLQLVSAVVCSQFNESI